MAGWLRTAVRWLAGTLPPPEFAAADPPAWVADVRVTCLPPGRVYSFRVRLWADRGTIDGSVRWCLFRLSQPSLDNLGPLRPAAIAELSALAERAVQEPTPRPKGLICDGLPCQVRLFRREPFTAVCECWNLAAWWFPPDPPRNLPPVVELAVRVCGDHV